MKKIIAIFLCLAMTVSMSACIGSSKSETELNIYFKDVKTNELTAEKAKYTLSQNTVDMANFAINKLKEGPQSSSLARTIPQNTEILDFSVKNESAAINFSKEFKGLKGYELLIARFSVVRTLCDVPGITSVLITVEGEALISDTTGKEIGYLSKKDIVLDIDTSVPQPQETTVVTLYFATSDATALKAEERKVITQETLSIEKTIINELLKGPTSPELVNVMPSGTKLLSIETKDGICYVNLSGEFLSKFIGGTGILTVYSIVNSLCTIESVSAVQILIEGEKGQEFGNYVFDEPIEANLGLVQKK